MSDTLQASSFHRPLHILALSLLLALPLVGCGPTDDDDAADDDDGPDTIDPGDFDSSEAVTGDWSCVGSSAELVAGEAGALDGLVEDFQDDIPVAGARVRLWLDNDPTGSAAEALEAVSDSEGRFSFDISEGILACSPFAARVWTEFDPPETYQTFQNNLIVSGEPPFAQSFTSVSYATYQLLPLTVGVEPQPGQGIAAGRVTDCVGEPIANAEAAVGNIDWITGEFTEAEGYAMRYFENEDPAHDQLWTSADGLFGGMNVPPGEEWSLLVWGIPQDEAHCQTTDSDDVIWSTPNEVYCLLSWSSIAVQPDSVNIANVELDVVPDGCED